MSIIYYIGLDSSHNISADMKASDVESLISATFSPLYVFVALLLCYLFVRLCEMGYVVKMNRR